ncbi:hypothetical protein SXCC_02063 [Gluconacetobacter sp. SXCC-1]|nr:hypothetical protein SXCC_02063 [Gluconacetobacter sp. SXCC-1]
MEAGSRAAEAAAPDMRAYFRKFLRVVINRPPQIQIKQKNTH